MTVTNELSIYSAFYHIVNSKPTRAEAPNGLGKTYQSYKFVIPWKEAHRRGSGPYGR